MIHTCTLRNQYYLQVRANSPIRFAKWSGDIMLSHKREWNKGE